MAGEKVDLHLCSPITAPDGIAVLYYSSNNEKDGTVRPCTCTLSQYRLVFQVASTRGAPPRPPIAVPLMSIDTWSLTIADHTVTRALTALRKQQLSRDPSAYPTTSPETQVELAKGSLLIWALHTKHVWRHLLVLPNDRRVVKIIQKLLMRCASAPYLRSLPAFEYQQARCLPQQQSPVPPSAPEDSDHPTADTTQLWTVDFGWNIYDANREYNRQLCEDTSKPCSVVSAQGDLRGVGVGKDLRPWFRVVDLQSRPVAIEASYTRCPTYPRHVLLPSEVSLELASKAMSARARARIPVISYVHLGTGAVLARSSQPLMRSQYLAQDSHLCYTLINNSYDANNLEGSSVSVKGVVSPTDATTVHNAAAKHVNAPPPSLFADDDESRSTAPVGPSATEGNGGLPKSASSVVQTLLVADCRPFLAASGNMQLGGGYESGPFYPFCKTSFYEIDNVFGVAKAMRRLRSLVANFEGGRPEEGFWKALQDSQWLYHIQRILVCSVDVAQALERGDSVLVHCTDGWDRTSQCCAMAMLLLDPYYRTAYGFCLLLEKEFCAMGHKMAERSGHQVPGRTRCDTHAGVVASDTEGKRGKLEVAPIFTQFMDVVYQVVRQFPGAFEFTPNLLAHLSEAVFDCYDGTFLCNGEQERMLEGVRLLTSSTWTGILRRVEREKRGEAPINFVNEHYNAAVAWSAISANQIDIIVPNSSSKRLVLWEDLYLRWDSDEVGQRTAAHKAERTVKVSWGDAFDDYLSQQVEEACRAREAEIPHLRELEERAQATAPQHARPPQRERSAWCTFDSNVCFSCLRPSGIFAYTCDRCGNSLCRECGRHECAFEA